MSKMSVIPPDENRLEELPFRYRDGSIHFYDRTDDKFYSKSLFTYEWVKCGFPGELRSRYLHPEEYEKHQRILEEKYAQHAKQVKLKKIQYTNKIKSLMRNDYVIATLLEKISPLFGETTEILDNGKYLGFSYESLDGDVIVAGGMTQIITSDKLTNNTWTAGRYHHCITHMSVNVGKIRSVTFNEFHKIIIDKQELECLFPIVLGVFCRVEFEFDIPEEFRDHWKLEINGKFFMDHQIAINFPWIFKMVNGVPVKASGGLFVPLDKVQQN